LKHKSFEENLELAKEYIDKLLDPEVTLEDSVELYKKALEVITKAQNMVEEAKLKVKEIDKQKSGVKF